MVFCGPQGSDFYPRSPCGERPRIFLYLTFHKNFYPRSPCGERQASDISVKREASISIHALLAESDCPANWFDLWGWAISIHALLAESDAWVVFLNCNYPFISIHALLAESDAIRKRQVIPIIEFLSTLSLRRATWVLMGGSSCNGNFYPRSPCGERHANLRRHSSNDHFYPRSPCGERPARPTANNATTIFLSTLSLRRATVMQEIAQQRKQISIHALLAESDSAHPETRQPCAISIHALLAESDLNINRPTITIMKFLSTLSLRRATTRKI